MSNSIKYSTTGDTFSLRSGNFYFGIGDVPKGPTSSTGHWNGITPPSGGYTVYLNKASQGPSIYTCTSDSDLITITNKISSENYTTVQQALQYYSTQVDKSCVNRDYPNVTTNGLILNLDAGFTPSYPKSGTSWYDISLSGVTGQTINSPVFSSADGGSLSFDGTDEYASISSPSDQYAWTPSGPGLNNMTLNIWIKSSDSQGFIVSKPWNGGGDYNYYLSIYAFVLKTNSGSDATLLLPTSASTGNWENITCVVNPTQFATYRNGVIANNFTNHNITSNTPPSNTQVDLTAMCIFPYTPPFDLPSLAVQGNLAILQIYNRVLSATEILDSYNAYKTRFGL